MQRLRATSYGTTSATLRVMRVVIAHGGSGKAISMAAHVQGLEHRGVAATAIDLPLRKAEAAVSVYREATGLLSQPLDQLIVSGQSYGGRVASLLGAGMPGEYAGLVCFSYPLHRPGMPDWDVRSHHWSSISGPVLLLSGESDPFARIDLLHRAVEERLPQARLVSYPKVAHSLKGVLDDVLDQVAAFVAEVEREGGASQV